MSGTRDITPEGAETDFARKMSYSDYLQLDALLGAPGALERLIRFTSPFDHSGNPTISLPCGFTGDGVPLGFQLIGRHLDEGLLLRAGRAFERATVWNARHPEL